MRCPHVLTRNEGDRKFSINQNLTVFFVFRRTLSIMIEDSRYGQLGDLDLAANY
jgi:hypothetical protein